MVCERKKRGIYPLFFLKKFFTNLLHSSSKTPDMTSVLG